MSHGKVGQDVTARCSYTITEYTPLYQFSSFTSIERRPNLVINALLQPTVGRYTMTIQALHPSSTLPSIIRSLSGRDRCHAVKAFKTIRIYARNGTG